jgi:hypothetical protein
MDRKEAVVSVRPRRWRYLINIIVLVAVTFVLDAILGALISPPINWEKGFVFDAIAKMLLVAVVADWFCCVARSWRISA